MATVTRIPREARKHPPAHWVGDPPTHFKNPWPSFRNKHTLASVWRVRFGSDRNFVPVPEGRNELVQIAKPEWGRGRQGLKTTWLGHASFLVETTPDSQSSKQTSSEQSSAKSGHSTDPRGIRVLLDPVFCERMGPTSFLGPKRFSQPPCALEEVPEADAVCISHNHYDHLDVDAVKRLYFDQRRKKPLHFFCGLGTKNWFISCGIRGEDVTEMDWWDEVEVAIEDVGKMRLVCTPSQHLSRRGVWDDCQMLWCSWIIEERGSLPNRKLFFAGDTGLRTVTEDDIAAGKDISELPQCPAFKEIGDKFGPFDLALLPIGCYTPRTFMSGVHCSPEDSIEIHKLIQSKKSLGMHYGTVRGGLSAQYEDVREPPKQWKAACIASGLQWGQEICLCDIGETITIEKEIGVSVASPVVVQVSRLVY